MVKRKPGRRKPTTASRSNSLSQKEEMELSQNPKMIIEKIIQIQDPQLILDNRDEEVEEIPSLNPKEPNEVEVLQLQNPNLVEADDEAVVVDDETLIQNPNRVEEGMNIQNPKLIEVDTVIITNTVEKEQCLNIGSPSLLGLEGVLENQNPNLIEGDEGMKNQNPNLSERDEVIGNGNPNLSEGDEGMKNKNPNLSEGDEVMGNGNPNLIEVDELLEIENPNSLPMYVDIQSPTFMEEVEETGNGEPGADDDQQCQQLVGEEKHQEIEEPEGMIISPPQTISDIPDSHIPDVIFENPPLSIPRKATKRKKPLNKTQRAALEKKVQLVKENLEPIPFIPSKTLDFSRHEKLFKLLGLWDFAHIKFDREIQTDLLAQLIASYSSTSRGSMVNDWKVMVNRADLGRALKLPVKKDKGTALATADLDPEVFSEESISFILEFVSKWILLHDEEMWMTPNEVLGFIKLIKEGNLLKVDWPGLMWFMVEKELIQGAQLKSCYYASHLQYLMKAQREDLFKKEPRVEVLAVDGEDDLDLKMGSLEDLEKQEFEKQEYEKQQTELSLGQGNNESHVRDEDFLDFPEIKGEQWLLDGKNNANGFYLRRCNSDVVEGFGDQRLTKKEDEEQRYGVSTEGPSLERLASTDLFQAMEGKTSSPYNPHPMNLHDEEFLQSRANTDMNLGGPSTFGTSFKRELSQEDDDCDDSLNDHHKRMRNEGRWDHKQTETDFCLEQMINLANKARTVNAANEQACSEANMNVQVLITEVQQRDETIENLQKVRLEERQTRDAEIYKLESELLLMSNLLEGYKKALKENRRAFSEYRELVPYPVEPLYKDADGPGGVVLSTKEWKRQRLEKEEEDKLKRSVLEENIKDFQLCWFDRLEECQGKVSMMDERLCESAMEVNRLKEISDKRKTSETRSCIEEEEYTGLHS
ncbi:hypothetical protein GIB67_025502 [Kingdonia uniflora]|uniref:Uncharacterized protein n=1 Tax=Kingdonia uniflora TaxID=39325 RepID=A0A7J7PCI9_9MAGN|nr:hypothetical protein GIB67_025502 [Kingdonia uniflora]